MHVVQPAGFDEEVKVMAALTTEATADRVVAAGLATRAEVEALARDLHAFARDPFAVMSLPRIVQAWAGGVRRRLRSTRLRHRLRRVDAQAEGRGNVDADQVPWRTTTSGTTSPG
jgi:hypothetical protein